MVLFPIWVLFQSHPILRGLPTWSNSQMAIPSPGGSWAAAMACDCGVMITLCWVEHLRFRGSSCKGTHILKGCWGRPLSRPGRGHDLPSHSELSQTCEGRCIHMCLQMWMVALLPLGPRVSCMGLHQMLAIYLLLSWGTWLLCPPQREVGPGLHPCPESL